MNVSGSALAISGTTSNQRYDHYCCYSSSLPFTLTHTRTHAHTHAHTHTHARTHAPRIQLYVSSRQLRSSANIRILRLPPAHLKSCDQRAFFCQAPILWKNPSYTLRHCSSIASFQSALKTHLFSSGLSMPYQCACSCVPLVRACVRVCVCVCWKWWEKCWMKCCNVFM